MACVLLNSWRGKKRVCLLKKTMNVLLKVPPSSIIFQREMEIRWQVFSHEPMAFKNLSNVILGIYFRPT